VQQTAKRQAGARRPAAPLARTSSARSACVPREGMSGRGDPAAPRKREPLTAVVGERPGSWSQRGPRQHAAASRHCGGAVQPPVGGIPTNQITRHWRVASGPLRWHPSTLMPTD
jgi:hypothetical protein